ncbi:MAG: hypothetical protein AAGA58_16405 [Verrucomicrobiota bacterium]
MSDYENLIRQVASGIFGEESSLETPEGIQTKIHPLPAKKDVQVRLDEASHPLALLATRDAEEVRSFYSTKWNFPDFPHLQKLAVSILTFPQLALSECDNEFWITFSESDDISVSIPGESDMPDGFFAKYPFAAKDGILEFFQCFGGLTDWTPPPGGVFYTAQEALEIDVHPAVELFDITGWEGSLPLYKGGSGDGILIRPNGTVGCFYHEAVGIAGEEPLGEIDYTFPSLIEHFADYIRQPAEGNYCGNEQKDESPFYY